MRESYIFFLVGVIYSNLSFSQEVITDRVQKGQEIVLTDTARKIYLQGKIYEKSGKPILGTSVKAAYISIKGTDKITNPGEHGAYLINVTDLPINTKTITVVCSIVGYISEEINIKKPLSETTLDFHLRQKSIEHPEPK